LIVSKLFIEIPPLAGFFIGLTGWLLPELNPTSSAGKNLQYYQLKTVIL
jgi:hypothetical protein